MVRFVCRQEPASCASAISRHLLLRWQCRRQMPPISECSIVLAVQRRSVIQLKGPLGIIGIEGGRKEQKSDRSARCHTGILRRETVAQASCRPPQLGGELLWEAHCCCCHPLVCSCGHPSRADRRTTYHPSGRQLSVWRRICRPPPVHWCVWVSTRACPIVHGTPALA